MSLNPNLNPNTKQPYRIENEYFILTRTDILYEITTDIKTKFSGKGSLILTSLRLFIISKEKSDKFESLEIPLSRIDNETFNQPFFGKNYIQSNILNDTTFKLQLQVVEFKVWFTNKHCGTFVPAFFQLLDSLRQNKFQCHDVNLENALQGGIFNTVFAIDPNDPSIFFIDQPEIVMPPPNNIEPQSTVINDNNNGEMKLNTVDVNDFVIIPNKSNVNQNNEGDKNISNNSGFEYKEPQAYNYIEPKSNFVFNDNNYSNNNQQGLITADLNDNNNNQFMNNNNQMQNIPPPFAMNNPQQMTYDNDFNMPDQNNNNNYNPYPTFNDNNYYK